MPEHVHCSETRPIGRFGKLRYLMYLRVLSWLARDHPTTPPHHQITPTPHSNAGVFFDIALYRGMSGCHSSIRSGTLAPYSLMSIRQPRQLKRHVIKIYKMRLKQHTLEPRSSKVNTPRNICFPFFSLSVWRAVPKILLLPGRATLTLQVVTVLQVRPRWIILELCF